MKWLTRGAAALGASYPRSVRVVIVGGGVSGLTSAAAALEEGWEAHIVARERFASTVSVVAAAVWTAIDLEPRPLTRQWALISRDRFSAIARDPGSGVVPLLQWELERDDPGPTWWEDTPHVRRIEADRLPPGYAAGFEIDGFTIEPPTYLAWLTDRITSLGATFEIAEVDRLDDLEGDLVINCSGLGAATLANDAGVFPIRGQVVAVANQGIREGIADESDPHRIAYVYPRSKEVILGGTRQADEEDVTAHQQTTSRILGDCFALDPRLAGADLLDVRVGLRPGRAAVRVERDSLTDGGPIIHNYGHSGAGFILSWGCAAEVIRLARGGGNAPDH